MRERDNAGVGVLLHVLPRLLKAEARGDAVEVTHNSRRYLLRPFWIGEGYPQDVERIMGKIVNAPVEPHPVITAKRLSPGAVSMLHEAGCSWADAAGHAEIMHPDGIFVSRARPTPLPDQATSGLTWSRSAYQIAEYLLSRRVRYPAMRNAGGVDRVAQVAEATGLSTAQVSRVLRKFDDEGYTSKFGAERGPHAARAWEDASRLLSDWAGHFSRSARLGPRAEIHVLSRDPLDWIRLIDTRLQGERWAASGWVAAQELAPFVTSTPDLLVYVPDDHFEQSVQRMLADSDVTAVERGGRIHVRPATTHVFEFVEVYERTRVVSPVRAYADLLRIGGRGAEAAEHLREVAIEF